MNYYAKSARMIAEKITPSAVSAVILKEFLDKVSQDERYLDSDDVVELFRGCLPDYSTAEKWTLGELVLHNPTEDKFARIDFIYLVCVNQFCGATIELDLTRWSSRGSFRRAAFKTMSGRGRSYLFCEDSNGPRVFVSRVEETRTDIEE